MREGATEGVIENTIVGVNDDECPDLTPQDIDSDDKMEIDEAEAPRRSERIGQGLNKTLRYVAAMVKLGEGSTTKKIETQRSRQQR